jgi:hypothetical protein
VPLNKKVELKESEPEKASLSLSSTVLGRNTETTKPIDFVKREVGVGPKLNVRERVSDLLSLELTVRRELMEILLVAENIFVLVNVLDSVNRSDLL